MSPALRPPPHPDGDPVWSDRFVVDITRGEDLAEQVGVSALSGRTLVWRGVANMAWPLDTALYRRVSRHRTVPVGESDVAREEQSLLAGARRLLFDRRDGFRLSDLELLASLQHHGAATRLLDVSHNAMVSMWFATEDRTQDDADGALFAIDVTGRELPHERSTDPLPDLLVDPGLWLWRPPPVEERIRVQQGAFILSPVPDPVPAETSLALHLADWPGLSSGPGGDPLTSPPLGVFRIPAAIKPRLREFLRTLLGYDAESLYPDLPGYARARRA